MSEIASKPNSGPNASLAQPSAKKGAGTDHDLLFAALFGGVVTAGAMASPEADSELDGIAVGSIFAAADTAANSNSDGEADILASMQAVASMMSGHRGEGRKSKLSGDADKRMIDEQVLPHDLHLDAEEIVNAHPMIVGLMPTQQQAGTSLPTAHTSAVMGQMAFEDEAIMSRPHMSRTAVHNLNPSVGQSQMAALSSSSLQTMKPVENAHANGYPIGEVLTGEVKGENTEPRSVGRTTIRSTPYQSQLNQAALANSKTVGGSDANLSDIGEDMQFDSPDVLMREVSGQVERVVGRMNGKTASGESLSANAVRQMQAAGVSAGGHMAQQNNGQSSSQSGSFVSASAGMSNASVMDILDMAQDNWTEMLLQRVERGLAGGKDKIDFYLNPRNLGKMRVSLVVRNDRTNVHIQTETGAAAQMLSEAEVRLAQMMDASGLKFGNLTSQHNQNFSGSFADQNPAHGRDGGASHTAASHAEDGTDEPNAEISVEQSENLINMQA